MILKTYQDIKINRYLIGTYSYHPHEVPAVPAVLSPLLPSRCPFHESHVISWLHDISSLHVASCMLTPRAPSATPRDLWRLLLNKLYAKNIEEGKSENDMFSHVSSCLHSVSVRFVLVSVNLVRVSSAPHHPAGWIIAKASTDLTHTSTYFSHFLFWPLRFMCSETNRSYTFTLNSCTEYHWIAFNDVLLFYHVYQSSTDYRSNDITVI